MRVFSTTNGWYAVVAGPINASSLEEFRRKLSQQSEVPRDAFPATGKGFVKQVWQGDTTGTRLGAPQTTVTQYHSSPSVSITDELPDQKNISHDDTLPAAAATPKSQDVPPLAYYVLIIITIFFGAKTLIYIQ